MARIHASKRIMERFDTRPANGHAHFLHISIPFFWNMKAVALKLSYKPFTQQYNVLKIPIF